MSAGVRSRSQNTDTAENSTSAFKRSVRAAGVLEAALAVHRGGGLADQREHRNPARKRLAQPGDEVQRAPPDVATTTPRPAPLRLYPSAIVAAENSCLASTALMPGVEVRGVVHVLDVGAVHAEDVVDSDCRQVPDDVVDHPVLPWHRLTCLAVTAQDTTRG